MKFVKYFLQNKPLTILLLALVFIGGLFSYVKMGKLEDAPFTIKQALVITPYPGASSAEVQSQVTDILEEAIQSLGELDYLESENRAGLSKITVYVKKEIRAADMQQLWDKLRRKVSDVQSKLPAGAGTSIVNDDFGDVLGVFYGLVGDNYSYRELEQQSKLIKNDLLKVKDVAKVELFGIQIPTIDVVISPSIMASSGITTKEIAQAFESQNRVVDAGALETEKNRIRIESTGNFYSLDEIKSLSIVSKTGEYFRLGDIADIQEGYRTPTSNIMRVDGSPAIGIAVSTVPTGNVVDMSKLVAERIEFFSNTMPDGFELTSVYDQGYESAVANDLFIINLIISVLTVVALLLFFIGFKNGILVGSGLVFSIFATLIVMYASGIALQRMSLAAIVIAMGMLVDNAIVVSDSVLISLQRGMRKRVAIMRAVSSTAMPLLAATVIAILTFIPLYLSPHATGELMTTLVIVIGVSLMFSWVFALIQTPFCIQEFVRRPRPDEITSDPYNGAIYNSFRQMLRKVIKHKYMTIVSMLVLLILSGWSFKFIPVVFTPTLDKPYFTINMWLPNETRIEQTDKISTKIADYIKSFPQTERVNTFVGQTAPRYYLANAAFGPQPNFASILIKCKDAKYSVELQQILRDPLNKEFPEAFVKVNSFEMTSSPEALIEARFLGPDAKVLDSLASVAIEIMRKNPKTTNSRNEWGNMSLMIKPIYDPVKAGIVGISKSSMMESVKSLNDGAAIGVYRDNEDNVPVLLKSDVDHNMSVDDLRNFSVWNGLSSAPLGQITETIETSWEYPLIKTYNRQLSMAAMCDVKEGTTMREVHSEIRNEIEQIELPEGYVFFWDSQFKDQGEAMSALMKFFPLAFIFLVLILVALLGNFKQPIIIICILPLSLIGVVFGLLMTGFNFGFFPIAGWLGLLGMIIKNVIVLIDEINVQHRSGEQLYKAIIEATVSRSRPVIMAAATTIFGMLPLVFDVAFGGMAITIIFGLTFATLLTLFVTPALYAVFYKVSSHSHKQNKWGSNS